MEKLNKIERLKRERSPADFASQLAAVDWSRPDEALRFYLKNYGIYNIKLRPESWMIRLRVDGGRIDPRRLRRIGRIAKEHELRILLSARAQIELHDLGPEAVYPLWKSLRSEGFETLQTLTDNFRALVIDPLSDCASDGHIDTFDILKKIQTLFLAQPEWIGTLPRKFNTALVGRETPSFNPWGNDLLFALAWKEGRWGFNLYLGGKNSQTAQDANIFCLPEEAPKLFEAVARAYRAHGPRSSRSKARLFHLIEAIKMPKMRTLIEAEYGAPLSPGGELKMRSSAENRDHLLPIARYGRYGEITSQELLQIAEQAEKDRLTLRLTPRQELWAFQAEHIKTHEAGLEPSNHAKSTPSITACAGSRYCPLSLWDIKKDTQALPLDRLERLGISVGFSGCLKGCGRHHHSDLGLIGLRTNLYGPTEPAIRLYLGALQAPHPWPARLLYYSIPLRKLDGLIEVILDDYEASGEKNFEMFSRNILSKFSTEFLQLWFLCRQDGSVDTRLHRFSSEDDATTFLRRVLADREEAPEQQIRRLSHQLWDQA